MTELRKLLAAVISLMLDCSSVMCLALISLMIVALGYGNQNLSQERLWLFKERTVVVSKAKPALSKGKVEVPLRFQEIGQRKSSKGHGATGS